MPYIKSEAQNYVLEGGTPRNTGELNFLICATLIDIPEPDHTLSYIVNDYLEAHAGLAYRYINDVLGALYGAALEMDRRGFTGMSDYLRSWAERWYVRIAGPYEDLKMEQNGDIFP